MKKKSNNLTKYLFTLSIIVFLIALTPLPTTPILGLSLIILSFAFASLNKSQKNNN